jgi:hypothetical protein
MRFLASIPAAARRGAFVAAVAVLAGCNNTTTSPGRVPGILRVPNPYSFEEAAAKAVPGDTILVYLTPLPLSGTVTIASDKTPLLIRGTKTYPVLAGIASAPLLRFQQPKAGTRIEAMGFSGGTSTVQVTGSGSLEIADSRFVGGGVQVAGSGSGLTIDVSDVIFRDAGLYSVQLTNGAAAGVTRCTIVRAGDCGINVGAGCTAGVTRSIVWMSANFGIACLGGTLADSTGCNDVFGSGTAPYTQCVPPLADIHLDPKFCDPGINKYSLDSTSPCAPDSSGGCGLIGTLGVGCGP